MTTETAQGRIFNFSPGPAALPLPVLRRVRDEMLCLPGAGASILEISHRGPEFTQILSEATERLTQLLSIPDDYQVLFLQGGSRLQFSMVPMNLLRAPGGSADYLLSGSWGVKAADEARREGAVKPIWDGASENYARMPRPDELIVSEGAAYVHSTSNETIQGIAFPDDWESGPWNGPEVPLVCDTSSDFLSRPMAVNRFGLIYACAQKNAGPAGVTVLIIRRDLLDRSCDQLPGYLNYRLHAKNGSLYNTPPTFGIYVLNLVCQWLQDEVGGLAAMHRVNQSKASTLYQAIDSSDGFYRGHAHPESRSRMNVTFVLSDDALQQEFLAAAGRQGLGSLKGHRSVGGIRASIYNAMPVAGVEALGQFMVDFRNRKG